VRSWWTHAKPSEASLKFTLATDGRSQKAAHSYSGYQMAQRCGLTEDEGFVVKRKTSGSTDLNSG
jgi:hypothetical protein